MTELQFLIDLLLNHKLSPSTKKLVGDRIGFVEESLRPKQAPIYIKASSGVDLPMASQAPSTQRLLEKQDTPLPVAVSAASRIIGGEVNTGNGTKGPRKF